jgi:hypothetical protein
MHDNRIFESVYEILKPLLGKLSARKAIELACQKSSKPIDSLVPGDVDDLCDGLRPMLRTLLGNQTASQVLTEIQGKTA